MIGWSYEKDTHMAALPHGDFRAGRSGEIKSVIKFLLQKVLFCDILKVPQNHNRPTHLLKIGVYFYALLILR